MLLLTLVDPANMNGFSVQYTFDGLRGHVNAPVSDTTGRYPLTARTAAGGAVRAADGGVTFRPPAILESQPLDQLNPGAQPLSFGARVRMALSDTIDGANVVQKGYSVGGITQYKLQVDGRAGEPSCVLASATQIYRLIAPVGVADGRWHALDCHRAGPLLTIYVDGLPRACMLVPTELSIVNNVPLRIGGKGTNPDNDQFVGVVDDVYISIGSGGAWTMWRDTARYGPVYVPN